MNKIDLPKSAILALTLKCNSRCLMCDIWKRKTEKEIDPAVYRKLPSGLQSIDITGGEPFLRNDLSEIIKIIKETCPRVKLLITTNGLLVNKIKQLTPKLLKIYKNLTFRVSLDGWGKIHDRIRGVAGAFEKVRETLKTLKKIQIQDLGIIFTLMELNKNELEKILAFCRQEKLNFSLNLVHDSPIYFGQKHLNLRPKPGEIKKALTLVEKFFFPGLKPQNWAKAWFYQKLGEYSKSGRRLMSCNAGEGFFYMDPKANIYLCHFQDWKIGNLQTQSFVEIWQGSLRKKFLKRAINCHDCWMICTVKNRLKANPWQMLFGRPI